MAVLIIVPVELGIPSVVSIRVKLMLMDLGSVPIICKQAMLVAELWDMAMAWCGLLGALRLLVISVLLTHSCTRLL